MEQRLNLLLKAIISEHIKAAQPVSSDLIVSKYLPGLSSATIRNEMAKLEDLGYVSQPHTSAGRTPTVRGYQYYVGNFLKEKELNKKYQQVLKSRIQYLKNQQLIKELAKGLADLSKETIFVAFSSHSFYYTGLANLFSQPEFLEHNLVCYLSKIVDNLDKILSQIFSDFNQDIKILLGRENPFSQDCATILTSYRFKKDKGLLGILGPIRMDYSTNLALIKFARNLINR